MRNILCVLSFAVLSCCVEAADIEHQMTEEQKKFLQEESSPTVQPTGPDMGTLLTKMGLTIAGLSLLTIAGVYLLKRSGLGKFSGFSNTGYIQLVEQKYISPKTSLWLVTINKHPFVIIDSPQSSSVHTLPDDTLPIEQPKE